MRVPLIYKNSPLFGVDIGYRTAKVVQLKPAGKSWSVMGYGAAEFPDDAIIEGIISDPKAIAAVVKSILAKPTAGRFSAKRAAVSLPVSKIFIRPLSLPKMSQADLEQAVRFEAEQYVPVPITDLYIDHEIIGTSKSEAGEEHTDVLMVAAPRAIVDSYIRLFDEIGLEIAWLESSLRSVSRAILKTGEGNDTCLVIDFNSRSTDLAVIDQSMRLTGTIPGGGDEITDILVKTLGIKQDEAQEIKYKFGITKGDVQSKVMPALEPRLTAILTEVKKVIKYYQERSEGKQVIKRILLSGGTASMPGLSDYLSKQLGLPIAVSDPWKQLQLGRLAAPDGRSAPKYTTAIGLAIMEGEV